MVITRKAGAMKKRRLAARKRNADNAKIAELRAIRAQIVAGTYVPPSEEPETDETDDAEGADETEGSEGGQDGQGGSETEDGDNGGQDTGNGSESGQEGSQDGQGGSETGSGETGGQTDGAGRGAGSGEAGGAAAEKSPLDQWSEDELRTFIEQNGGRFDRRWGKLRLVEEAKKHA